MTIDERIEALTMNLEPAFRDIQELKELAHQDGENIRAPARIAEAHQRPQRRESVLRQKPERIEDLEENR